MTSEDKEKKSPAKRPQKGPDEEITPEVLEFINAIDDYKQKQNRPFPNWSEILKIVHDLGYRKIADTGATDEADKD